MSYVKDYTRINWENYSSGGTPLNATNLNKMDYSIDAIEDELVILDTTKGDASVLNGCCNSIVYDSTSGTFTFTFVDGTEVIADLNIEKIPVSFSMDSDGIITMTTSDGSTYTADVGSLIKQYTFTDSDEIDFTVTEDEDGNKNVTASLINGSISGQKLQPNYLADCVSAKQSAESANASAQGYASSSALSSYDAEAYAVGTRNGEDVESDDPTYHNNAKYYAESVAPTPIATTAIAGKVKPDGTTITVDADGTIHSFAQAESVDWENVNDKPFDAVGEGLTVDDDGEVSADVKSVSVASANGVQSISVNGVSTDVVGTRYLDVTNVLSTSVDTDYVFTDAHITADSVIDVYSTIFGVNPSNVTVSNGTCTVTFPKHTDAVEMTCRIYIK